VFCWDVDVVSGRNRTADWNLTAISVITSYPSEAPPAPIYMDSSLPFEDRLPKEIPYTFKDLERETKPQARNTTPIDKHGPVEPN